MEAIYGVAKIDDFKVKTVVGKKGKATVSAIELDGQELAPTKRFWKSLSRRFGFNTKMTKFFNYTEIFDRVTKVVPNSTVRYCIENTGTKPKLLAVTNPNQPYVKFDDLKELLMQPKNMIAASPIYSEGMVRSVHNTIVPFATKIKDDVFHTQFVVDTPIDGFGKPAIYVSLLREICTNGAVAQQNKFRTDIAVGKGKDSILYTLDRAFSSFSNESAHNVLIDRFSMASHTWASVAEAMRVHKTIVKVHGMGGLKGQKPLVISREMGTSSKDISILQPFFEKIGDINAKYGVTNIDAISRKRQVQLTTQATVYDLLNYVTEVATHHATAPGAKTLQALVGTLVGGEYDLEGIDANVTSHEDLYLSSGVVAAQLHDNSSIIGDDD